ncbi:SDR family oxidoreductase [Streptomyces sp. NBC_01476]|uniref:SDR family NAD(P)-dependent oxidoreductase n=1 Tax=Streptomyces sp. NBC_01476 TaxID=2903881 RepID=UPI002E359A39|nr:SDR family oxidoreductase [Streptomyces sp. NBC_01476]
MSDLSGRTTIVVGAGRGLGRGVASALAEAGAPVVAVSRTVTDFPEPANGSGAIRTETADAGDPSAVADLIDRHQPTGIVVVAGASLYMRPLQQHTWESFSAHWHSDVRISFHWVREVLLTPLRPGSRVVVFGSGAALAGSPLSGGYAGAKATQRFITAYAQQEAERAGLDIAFTVVMPRMTPSTAFGRSAVRAYAARSGVPEEEFVRKMGPVLTPEGAGAAVVELLTVDASSLAPGYLLTGAGLRRAD